MSRIGKQTINIPDGVNVDVKDGVVTVKGPKGELKRTLNEKVTVNVSDGVVTCDVVNKEDKEERSLWGTYASHIKNMVVGVSEGFTKELEVNGVKQIIGSEFCSSCYTGNGFFSKVKQDLGKQESGRNMLIVGMV